MTEQKIGANFLLLHTAQIYIFLINKRHGLVVESCNRRFGQETIHPTKKFTSKDGFKGNDSLISGMLTPLRCFLCVKNNNKICQLDKLIQSFSDIFHNSLT